MPTDNPKEGENEEYAVTAQYPSTKSYIDNPINIKIPDACLDPLGGPCPHDKIQEKREMNPV